LNTLNIRRNRFHKQNHGCNYRFTLRQVNIDLGVIEMNGDHTIMGYQEKPTIEYLVSMGIYIFEPAVLRYIPKHKYLDFPDLIKLPT
jgi:NDP-sugar pyrophosphorylase family protein